MNKIKQLLKKLPGFRFFIDVMNNPYFRFKLINANTEKIFTYKIRERKKWGSVSLSGIGSDLYQTRLIIKKLPELLKEMNITRILDIPCGDFHWMSRVVLNSVDYIGADIVKE